MHGLKHADTLRKDVPVSAPEPKPILSERDWEEWQKGLDKPIETMQQPILVPYIDVAEAQMEDYEAFIACEHVPLPLLVSPTVWNKYLRELGHDGTIDAFLSGEMQEYQANEEYIESMSRMMQAEKEV